MSKEKALVVPKSNPVVGDTYTREDGIIFTYTTKGWMKAQNLKVGVSNAGL